jgi:hypothetical protein
MPLVICPIHGRAGGELVSHALDKIVSDRSSWPQKHLVHPITLAYEDIEYPGYMLQADIARVIQLGGMHEGGDTYRFTHEEGMETAIGMLTAACTRCVHELIEMQSVS